MSLSMVFNDFKKDCNIKNVIMDFSRKENLCILLGKGRGSSYETRYGLIRWEHPTEKKKISMNPNYSSTYIIIFLKKAVESFFFYLLIRISNFPLEKSKK